MDLMPRVSIIILNWNGWKDTIECLESLFQITYPNYDVIIIDNASNDDSLIKIQDFCKGNYFVRPDFFDYFTESKPVIIFEPNLKDQRNYQEIDNDNLRAKSNKRLYLICNSQNDGFAEGNNIGIRFALKNLQADYILLLNNDTVVNPLFLDELVKVGEMRSEVSMLSPFIYYYSEPNTIWFNKGVIRWSRCSIASHSNVQTDLSYLQSDYLSGCALLIKQEALLQVGLLDSSYFLYFEDVDYSVRMRRAGYEIVTVRESKVYHKVSRTTNRLFKANSVYYTHRNRIWFTLKYCPKGLLCIALINILTRSMCAFCYYETVRAHPCALAVINGLKEGFRW